MAARFYAPLARDGLKTVTLPDEEAHHLHHVLRLRAGADVIVFDGAGHEWRARVRAADKSGAQLALEEPSTSVPEPPVKVTLGIGVLKGDQMDAVVRDATMLGVSAIAPFVSEHVSVPSKAWQGGGAIARWHRVAVSSAKQCRRSVVPAVGAVQSLASLLAGAVGQTIIAAAEPPFSPSPLTFSPAEGRASSALALVGPEGGWSPSEVELLMQHGATLIQLGPRTLRAETAPTVLLTVLWTMWGW